MNLKNILTELRAEHARLQRAIEELERIHGIQSGAFPSRVPIKRLGRPKKK